MPSFPVHSLVSAVALRTPTAPTRSALTHPVHPHGSSLKDGGSAYEVALRGLSAGGWGLVAQFPAPLKSRGRDPFIPAGAWGLSAQFPAPLKASRS
ncbi:hypothetical protein GCM10017557_43110 [Streptomyces aurantiacus]|uniref:Uncharacterized protein n=1 Tax=Streptomyces aurantiacus TaxID=47760 RepID=A0A7G1P3C3_9ACTN|nr:hypothetical protein GCM10017557_43110 [Streptomyces aurantiacus]